eukprot:TRINITY_DN3692_c0_g1_i4.p2 TRINITY_DN3692_c0_g1~~TRINITY_DN3692_c0_g1_i4.p2  ORF type:complete len:371 (-),score=75.62 TRINITY_DN3692_c0_g1_i4:36-1094(-)
MLCLQFSQCSIGNIGQRQVGNQRIIKRQQICVRATSTYDKAAQGRATYQPSSFQELVEDAVKSLKFGLGDGLTRMEVEFPPLNVDGYKGASDAFIDSNVELALSGATKLAEDGKKVRLLLPDESEYNRSQNMFRSALQLAPNVSMGHLLEARATGVWGLVSKFQGDKGWSPEIPEGAQSAEVFIVVNASTVELSDVRKYVDDVVQNRAFVTWNLELDTLRADLGLLGFPPKEMQYQFLSQFKPVFYVRKRDYSKTVSVAPFVVNYSGALLREYPGPWQVMIQQSSGEYGCVAERKQRYNLGEFKEELAEVMGLNIEEEGSTLAFLRRGYKTSTWWEDDAEKEEYFCNDFIEN